MYHDTFPQHCNTFIIYFKFSHTSKTNPDKFTFYKTVDYFDMRSVPATNK